MAKKSKSKTFENIINWVNKSERLGRLLNAVLAALLVVIILGAAIAGLKQLKDCPLAGYLKPDAVELNKAAGK